jgi:hypothetical protein
VEYKARLILETLYSMRYIELLEPVLLVPASLDVWRWAGVVLALPQGDESTCLFTMPRGLLTQITTKQLAII